ncbi:UNVERIFIED_CONTAM: glycosyl transferase family 2 [Williamsia faeni]
MARSALWDFVTSVMGAGCMAERLKPTPLTASPTVSVVIPCYKYGKYLPGAVKSALDQPGIDVDVLIVDDASPDDSAAVAESLAAADPRVSVLVHETNRGHIATYNDGLRLARGTYVVLLSADDLLPDGALTRAVALLEARPDVAFVYGFPQYFEDTPPPVTSTVRSWTVWSGHEWIKRICQRGTGLVVSPEVVMRRTVMDELGGFDPAHPHAADFKIWMHAALRGSVGRVNGSDQAFYRVHGENMHLTDFKGEITDLRERRRAFQTFFEEEGSAVPEIADMEVVSRKAQAAEAVRRANHEIDCGADDSNSLHGEYSAIATELWPPVTRSYAWHAYQRRLAGRSNRFERGLSKLSFDLRYRLEWRRWRRFGT